MSQGIIYLIINKETGHKYIDSTTLPMNKEWQRHLEIARKMPSSMLHKALIQFGIHKFTIKEIDECNERLLKDRKEYWIQQYNPEYNKFDIIQENTPEEEPEKEQPKNIRHYTFKPEHRGDGKCASIRIQGIKIETGEIREWENSRAAAEELTGKRHYNANILK